MKIREITDGSWLYCDNEQAAKMSDYKLHAALPIRYFDSHHARIYQLLKKAVEDGVIPGFKILNRGDSFELEKSLGGNDVTINEDPGSRLFNNPFTIYLFDNFDADTIANLCLQLERVMDDVPPATRDNLSIADLDLTEHITFRQERLNGTYIKIAGAGPEDLQALQTQGQQSKEYQSLKKECKQHSEIHESINKPQDNERKAKQKEDAIRGFHNANYGHFKSALQSPVITQQVQAACDLLKIDFKQLSNKKTEDEWLEIITRQYRLATLQYHPDKILNPQYSDTPKKAQDIFELVKAASEILKNIAKNPSVLDKKKILEQERHLPQYQYELREGFSEDPYFYIRMGASSATYFVIQNWTMDSVPEEVSTTSDQTAIQIYKPQLHIFNENERVAKRMPGYKAFYHLFMANALPQRFQQGHFSMIFGSKDEPFSPAQRWLLAKVLTTPEFICFMDSNDFVHLAIRATKQGVLNIGKDVTEVLIYYYNNYPETLYQRRIERLSKIQNFDANKVAETILSKPQNLSVLDDRAMDQLSALSELRAYILADKELTLRLSIYYLDYQLLWPFFKTRENVEELREIKDIKHVAIRQLIYGNAGFLPFFSNQALEVFINFIEDNQEHLPIWLKSEIEQELEQRAGRKDIIKVSAVQINFRNGYESPLDACQFIKNTFISEDSNVVFFLNKEALIWLAGEPEVHWSQYLPIAEALLKLGEDKVAERYLLCIAKEIELITENKNAKGLYSEIKSQEETLNKINKEWKQQTINELVEEYQQILYGTKKGNKDTVITKLKIFKATAQVSNISKEYIDSQKNKFNTLVNRLRDGENSEGLKQEFMGLREVIERHRNWKEFSAKDKDGHWIIGGPIFSLMYEVIGINDRNARLWNNDDDEKKSHREIYGIKKSAGIIANLRRLFFVYECLSTPEDFYTVLQTHTSDQSSRSFIGLTDFREELIEEHLLRFADNEFAVFVEGNREAAGYKTCRYVDIQNIRDFANLYILYQALGQEEHLMSLLPDAYQQLLEAENTYQRVNPSGLLRESHNKIDPNRPVVKYIEIRRQNALTNPILEELAVQHQLTHLVKNLFEALNFHQKQKPDKHQQKLILFSKSISVPNNSSQTAESIQRETQREMNLLADFLQNYSEHPVYHSVLQAIYSDHILNKYFGMKDIDLEKVAKKRIAKALESAIRKGQRQISLPGIANLLPAVTRPALLLNQPLALEDNERPSANPELVQVIQRPVYPPTARVEDHALKFPDIIAFEDIRASESSYAVNFNADQCVINYRNAYHAASAQFNLEGTSEKTKNKLISFTEKLNNTASSYKKMVVSSAEYRKKVDSNKNISENQIPGFLLKRAEVDQHRKELANHAVKLERATMSIPQVLIDVVATFIGSLLGAVGLASLGAVASGAASLITGPAAIVVAPPLVISSVVISGIAGAVGGGLLAHKLTAKCIHSYNQSNNNNGYRSKACFFAQNAHEERSKIKKDCNESEDQNESLKLSLFDKLRHRIL